MWWTTTVKDIKPSVSAVAVITAVGVFYQEQFDLGQQRAQVELIRSSWIRSALLQRTSAAEPTTGQFMENVTRCENEEISST